MAFDLHAIQTDIATMLSTSFPNYKFFRSTVPEDEQVPHTSYGQVNPFFVLQYGPMSQVTRGKSMAGARNDEFSSWVQIIGMGSVEDDVASSLALMVDKLIGYKPVGATRLQPDGGVSDYGSRQYAVRPVLYYQSQKFDFNITQNGLGGYLSS